MADPTRNYKCEWTFGVRGDGWTETWYWVGTTPQLALAAMQSVTGARLDMLQNLVEIEQLKVSDEAILGDSLPNYDWASRSSKLTAGLSHQLKDVAMLCRAFSTQQAAGGGRPIVYQRPVELAGLPLEFVEFDNKGASIVPPNGVGLLTKVFGAWVGKMAAAGFAMKVTDKSQPLMPVTAVGANLGTAVVGISNGKILVKCPGHGLTATNANGIATTFRIKGVKFLATFTDPKGKGPLDGSGRSVVNRVHQFQAITQTGTPLALPIVNGEQTTTTDWLQLAYDAPSAFGPLFYAGGGLVQQRLPTYVPLGQIPGETPGTLIGPIIAERFNRRARGKRHFVEAGKSKKRGISAGIL